MINQKPKLSIHRIITAGLSGLAGGAVVAIEIWDHSATFPIAAAGSLVGALITGWAEYAIEKKHAKLNTPAPCIKKTSFKNTGY